MKSLKAKELLSSGGGKLPLRIIADNGGLGREITSTEVEVCNVHAYWQGLKSFTVVAAGGQGVSCAGCKEMQYPGKVPCIIISRNERCPEPLIEFSQENFIPLFSSSLNEHHIASRVKEFLREKLDSTAFVHGTLVRFGNTGILLTGESAAGKTECALDLVACGGRLVADDAVKITRRSGSLFGSCPPEIRAMVALKSRGVQHIRDIRDMHGPDAICEETRIDTVFRLETAGSVDPEISSMNVLGINFSVKCLIAQPGLRLSETILRIIEKQAYSGSQT